MGIVLEDRKLNCSIAQSYYDYFDLLADKSSPQVADAGLSHADILSSHEDILSDINSLLNDTISEGSAEEVLKEMIPFILLNEFAKSRQIGRG